MAKLTEQRQLANSGSARMLAGKRSVNFSETEEHKIKPHKLRNLRDHECCWFTVKRVINASHCRLWTPSAKSQNAFRYGGSWSENRRMPLLLPV
jgi:hypothetical protein